MEIFRMEIKSTRWHVWFVREALDKQQVTMNEEAGTKIQPYTV